jgi:SpoVK/Ycf46/Vps4 family AAA+-type ATPase
VCLTNFCSQTIVKTVVVFLIHGLRLSQGCHSCSFSAIDSAWLDPLCTNAGADLGAVLAEAQLYAVHAVLEAGGSASSVVVTAAHIEAACSKIKPSLPASEWRRLLGIYAQFMGPRAAAALGVGHLEPAAGHNRTQRATLA